MATACERVTAVLHADSIRPMLRSHQSLFLCIFYGLRILTTDTSFALHGSLKLAVCLGGILRQRDRPASINTTTAIVH